LQTPRPVRRTSPASAGRAFAPAEAILEPRG
jgi:hypothetical protein